MRFSPNPLEDWISAHENRARFVLGTSGVAAPRLSEVAPPLADEPLGYGEVPADAGLAQAIARLRGVPESEVLPTVGGTEADFLAFYALVEPGDRVLVEAPTYFPLAEVPRTLGARVERFRREPGNGFRVDVDDVLARLGPDVRLVALANPNNPTGAVVPPRDLVRLARGCEEAGAWLLVDEIFRDLSFHPQPPARTLHPRILATDSLTKCYGLAGLRCGWILAPQDLVARFAAAKALTTLVNPLLDARVATAALGAADRLLARGRAIATRNFEALSGFVARMRPRGVTWVEPACAPLSAIRLPPGLDDVGLCRGLLEAEDVLLVPGTFLELPGHVRVGFGAQPEVFGEGLARVERHFRERLTLAAP